MFEPILVVNDKKDTLVETINADNIIKVLISVNPVYSWLEDNICSISYKLLKGFVTNIIPLRNAGKEYFKVIVNKRVGFKGELWKLYNRLDKDNREGNLKIKSYFELMGLGYDGEFLGGRCPIDDIIKYLDN
ncbi:hypothetical protein [Clostridium weizhouense]|uniref:Uncharacterized protein n=1 Tax=Clostridium weizhouense TaxID=2859781 RepID=A0ABS7ARP5_9CLOT|nr:hypothetical protein [Clostridium weizhouense]MBW6411340.1 hypothetical protein [Clostridium weizhouense]